MGYFGETRSELLHQVYTMQQDCEALVLSQVASPNSGNRHQANKDSEA